MTTVKLVVAAIFLTAALSGCSKNSGSYEHISNSLQPEGQGILLSQKKGNLDQNNGFDEGELESLDSTGKTPLSDDTTSAEYKAAYGRSTAPLLPVYFAFDSSSIDADQFDNLNKSAAYLLENNSTELIIEGNCDERGTADYNIALGESRAQNVRQYLINSGIADSVISTISFGSEEPLYPESNETAWAANRRADLVIP